MSQAFSGVLPYLLAATGAGLLGGLIALFWTPSIKARSAIQHFAAGLVIAAVASDVIPEVEHVGTPLGILGGFAAGGLVMIGMKWLVLRFEKREARRGRLPVGLSAAAGFDTLVDGAIIRPASREAARSVRCLPWRWRPSSASSLSPSARSFRRAGESRGEVWR